MSDIDIDLATIQVQVSKDWHDGDTMQVCKNKSAVALAGSDIEVGDGQAGFTSGFASLRAALTDTASTLDSAFQTFHEAFTLLGSADTAVGDDYSQTDRHSARVMGRLGARMSAQ